MIIDAMLEGEPQIGVPETQTSKGRLVELVEFLSLNGQASHIDLWGGGLLSDSYKMKLKESIREAETAAGFVDVSAGNIREQFLRAEKNAARQQALALPTHVWRSFRAHLQGNTHPPSDEVRKAPGITFLTPADIERRKAALEHAGATLLFRDRIYQEEDRQIRNALPGAGDALRTYDMIRAANFRRRTMGLPLDLTFAGNAMLVDIPNIDPVLDGFDDPRSIAGKVLGSLGALIRQKGVVIGVTMNGLQWTYSDFSPGEILRVVDNLDQPVSGQRIDKFFNILNMRMTPE